MDPSNCFDGEETEDSEEDEFPSSTQKAHLSSHDSNSSTLDPDKIVQMPFFGSKKLVEDLCSAVLALPEATTADSEMIVITDDKICCLKGLAKSILNIQENAKDNDDDEIAFDVCHASPKRIKLDLPLIGNTDCQLSVGENLLPDVLVDSQCTAKKLSN